MTDQITPAMQAFWANDPAPQEMGVVLVKARDGRAELRLALESRHLNGHDTAHGGVVHLLADCAAGRVSSTVGAKDCAGMGKVLPRSRVRVYLA